MLLDFEFKGDADDQRSSSLIVPIYTQERSTGQYPFTCRIDSSNTSLIEPLSDRELEILILLAEGLTNREIASRLFVALNTVKAHTGNIYGKLGVHNRTQAVARARTLRLLP